MTCKDLAPLLLSLEDGSLAPGEETLVRAHLAGCAACRATEDRLGKLEQLLGRGLSVPEPGEAYFKAQRERLLLSAQSSRPDEKGSSSPAPAEFRRPRSARFVWAAAAAILILAAGAATYFGVPGLGVPARAPGVGSTAERPAPVAPRPSPTAQKTAPPEGAPRSLLPPHPEEPPGLPAPGAIVKTPKEAPPALGSGASARLAAMTEEAVDIGLAETPRDRVVALFGAAESRLGELGQVMHQDPGLASELAGAYLLLLGEGVKSVLRDGTESSQELALARRAARERARGHESTLLELVAVAQGKLKETIEDALAMSRELARP